MLSEKELEEFYNIAPLYINNNNGYVKALKAKFVLSKLYEDIGTRDDEEMNKFYCNTAYCILNLNEFADIRKIYDNIYKKAYNLDRINVTPYITESREDQIKSREISVITQVCLDTMPINATMINQINERLKYCFDISNKSSTESGVAKLLENSMIKDTSYVLTITKFYENYLQRENLDFKIINQEDNHYLYNIISLSNALIGIWLKFINDNDIMKLGVNLIAFMLKLRLIMLINENTELSWSKHKTILYNMMLLEFFKDYATHYDQYYEYFVEYETKYEQHVIKQLIDKHNKTESVNLKNWYKNLMRISVTILKHYKESLDVETKKIANEIFVDNTSSLIQINNESSLEPSSLNNIKSFVSYFDIFAIFDTLHESNSNQPNFDSLFKEEALRVYRYYDYDLDFIKGIQANLNTTFEMNIDFNISFKNNVDIEWKKLTSINKNIIGEMIKNIKNVDEVLKDISQNDYGDYGKRILNQTLTNSWDRIEDNYNFFNSVEFKGKLVNNIEIESIKEIAIQFYLVYDYSKEEKYLILGNELASIYIMKDMDRIINSFVDKLSERDFYVISAHVITLNKIFKINTNNWSALYNKYKTIKGKHYQTTSDDYLNKYNSLIFNCDKLTVGYDLICDLCKCSHYQTLSDKQIKLCEELNKIYNIPSKYFGFDIKNELNTNPTFTIVLNGLLDTNH